MSTKLDTHYYDSKLNPVEKINLSPEEKISLANDLLSFLEDKLSIGFLKKIISDFGKNSNIDKTNGLIADDLVCMCWNHRNNKDFIEILQLQLKDMSTGFCPQGRTHRLYQTLMAFS